MTDALSIIAEREQACRTCSKKSADPWDLRFCFPKAISLKAICLGGHNIFVCFAAPGQDGRIAINNDLRSAGA